MITYRHIPTDWNTFIPADLPADDTSRRVMMCGRRARYRLCGIPGISEQPRVINGRPGWCLECLAATFRDALHASLPDVRPLRELYAQVRNECGEAFYEAKALEDSVQNETLI